MCSDLLVLGFLMLIVLSRCCWIGVELRFVVMSMLIFRIFFLVGVMGWFFVFWCIIFFLRFLIMGSLVFRIDVRILRWFFYLWRFMWIVCSFWI